MHGGTGADSLLTACPALPCCPQAGADANVVDAEQRLPLVCAAALQHTQVVALLLPATQPLEGVEWSVEGVVAHAQELLQAARAGQAGSSAPVQVSDEAGNMDRTASGCDMCNGP